MSEGGDAWPGHWAPFGATADDGGVNVALWAESADAVEICLFDDAGAETRVPLSERTFHIWHGYLPGVRPGQRYGFRVHGPWDPQRGLRFNPAKLLTDPYARAIEGDLGYADEVFGHAVPGDGAHRDRRDSAPYVPRSVVVQDGFDWGDDRRPAHAWEDSVLYELHVKGFTKRHPGVPPELRGTYAGLAHPAAIEHLTSLGVTAVELLPVHHFVSERHLAHQRLSNYWGYNSLGYFAPHAAYSASGSRGQQVSEFKAMVKALHEAGLEVILDVVYNHTAEGNHEGPTLCFRGLGNRSYYKLQPDRRYYADYTGTGNTLDLSHPHVLQLVMDSLRYWVQEMHVDGFRFDLASALARSLHDVDMLSGFLTTIQQDPVLSQVKLIAEPWDVGSGGYQVGEFPPLWSEWNDQYRDTVRDFWRGWGGVRQLAFRLAGSSDLYADDGRLPSASINFVTAHDGFTLRDLVSYDRKHNDANGERNRDGTDANRSWNHGVEGDTADPVVQGARQQTMRSLLATLILSTGVPMITAGDELGRTQGGNNNAYCQDDETSWVDWELLGWQRDLLAFTRRLLALRAEHAAFRHEHFFEGRPRGGAGLKDLTWFAADGSEMTDTEWWAPHVHTLGMYLAGDALRGRTPTGERVVDDSFLLVLHGGGIPGAFVLPGRPWARGYRKIFDTSAPALPEATRSEPGGWVLPLAPRSLVLLQAER